MRQFIEKLRPYPEKLSVKRELLFSVCILGLGLVLGFVAKATDSVSLIGNIGTYLGFWVFAASLVSAYSRYPAAAAINVMLFFVAMLFSYYLYTYTVFSFFPRAYFWGWLVVALVSPIAGFFAWFSRAKGSAVSVIAAFPAAILFAEGFPALFSYHLVFAFSLLLGVLFILITRRGLKQQLLTFGVSIVLAAAARLLGLVQLLPF